MWLQLKRGESVCRCKPCRTEIFARVLLFVYQWRIFVDRMVDFRAWQSREPQLDMLHVFVEKLSCSPSLWSQEFRSLWYGSSRLHYHNYSIQIRRSCLFSFFTPLGGDEQKSVLSSPRYDKVVSNFRELSQCGGIGDLANARILQVAYQSIN